ncbi:putative alcohol dehydrogenase [Triangularia verruculosa]|uniref:Alcohol dehydrogenase n=1 Tax=Triangularia verruculosa TaxID=2587418 RepID=A0AAN6XDV6_9PEZI|nr:putative alcohol dehydrogenase [Triangularia verruculosa]
MDSSRLPKAMKAQILPSFNAPYRLTSLPLPVFTASNPHDILVKVLAASYCHTDLVLAQGQMSPFPPSFPHIGCHEFSGEVISLPEHSLSQFKIGDRVGVPGRSFRPCGKCFECRREPGDDEDKSVDGGGYSVYCVSAGNHGISAPGGFREFALVDSRQVTPLPDNISAVQGASLMCAGITIYAAIKKCGLTKGNRVGIMGCGGGLGHLGLQFAAKMGLQALGVDAADEPLRMAEEIAEALRQESGISAQVADVRVIKAEHLVQEMGKEDGKQDKADMGLDAVIILPESQKAFDYGISLLRTHGRCVVVSFPAEGFHISARDVVFRDISIVGSLVGSNKVLREMVTFAAEHNVQARIKTYPLKELNDLVLEYKKGKGEKLVIDMTLDD